MLPTPVFEADCKTLSREIIALSEALSQEPLVEKKLILVKNFPSVLSFFALFPQLQSPFSQYCELEQLILFSLCAIGQGEHIFGDENWQDPIAIEKLLISLVPVELFYREIGGIIGYHVACLSLLSSKTVQKRRGTYYPPYAVDLSTEDRQVRGYCIEGIRSLDQLAEIYPIGGAADRLGMRDPGSGGLQIAATLMFCGKTLLERLIEDLQAREFLHFKLFHRQIEVPIVMMTSDEKGGTKRIQTLLEEKGWYGRRPTQFFLFSQPLVPTIKTSGLWCLTTPGQLLFKPGGHGVIWKLASELGVIEKLLSIGKKKALLRQINNPIAGIDYGLLAFLGLGFIENKDFGFASCPVAKAMSEGVNIVVQTEKGSFLTNIEYCDVDHCQVEDRRGLLANTNLLFADLALIPKLLEELPIPGMLVNAKRVGYLDGEGQLCHEEVLRLESTMQNIADALIEPNEGGEGNKALKKSYITSNLRVKTISAIKKEWFSGEGELTSDIGLQTPERCLFDLLENHFDLLGNFCSFQLPAKRNFIDFYRLGPPFYLTYHPALGPLYQIIKQKLAGGELTLGSELHLEIADIYIEQLKLNGSLHIQGMGLLGHWDDQGLIRYSDQTSKCILKQVTVQNRGISWDRSSAIWKGEIHRIEECRITIEQGGEFYAEDVELSGNMEIYVPKYTRVTAKKEGEGVRWTQEALKAPSWRWQYLLEQGDSVSIKRVEGDV